MESVPTESGKKWFHITNRSGTLAFIRIRLSALGAAMTKDIFYGLPRVLPVYP